MKQMLKLRHDVAWASVRRSQPAGGRGKYDVFFFYNQATKKE